MIDTPYLDGIRSPEAEGRLLSVHNSTSKPPELFILKKFHITPHDEKYQKIHFFAKNKHNKSLLFCILGANEFSVNEPKRFESNDSEQPLATNPSQLSGKTLQPSSKSGLGASKVESEPPKKKRNLSSSSFNDTDAGAKAGSTSYDSDIEILLETPKVDTFL